MYYFSFDTGVLFQPSILGFQIPHINFNQKNAQNQMWTLLLSEKKLLQPLLSTSEIFIRCFIMEEKMFLNNKVKGIGIWFLSENQ